MKSTKVYQIGIIGFGFIGKVHAFGYRNLAFYCDPVPLPTRITHVVTGHPESAAKARDLVSADVASTDFRAVTENPDIDIVHICTPNHLHKDALVSAMENGKHIYCDKPLVAWWKETAAIRSALESYGATGQMTFQNRFFPSALRAKQLVERGSLGQILGFRAGYLHGGSADPRAPLKWKLSAAAGGGVIADLGSHVFDLVEHLAGPIESLTASTHVAYADRPISIGASQRAPVDAEDSVVMLARLESGAVGTLEATKVATGSEDELRCEIEGTRGALRFNLMDPHHLEFFDSALEFGNHATKGWQRIATGHRYESPATTFPSPKAAVGWIRSHVACLAEFLQAVADGRSGDPDLYQGIRVQRLMQCARRSVAERRWVDVDEIQPS